MTRVVAGVVFAGGMSKRFGCDKAEALHQGRKLINWSLAALEPFCARLFVSGRPHPLYDAFDDYPEAGLGPLGGLAAAFRAVAPLGYTHIMTAPCDTPDIAAPLLAALAGCSGPAYVGDCPVIGMWPTSLAPELIAYLENCGSRSMRAWADSVDAIEIGGNVPVANINYPFDLAGHRRRHG